MKKHSPRTARTNAAIRTLRTDSVETNNHWMLIEPGGVAIVTQKRGEPSSGTVRLKRKEFEKFIRWYNRPTKHP